MKERKITMIGRRQGTNVQMMCNAYQLFLLTHQQSTLDYPMASNIPEGFNGEVACNAATHHLIDNGKEKYGFAY
jgi:hypothetical protein